MSTGMVECVNPAHTERHHRPESAQGRECAARARAASGTTSVPVAPPSPAAAPAATRRPGEVSRGLRRVLDAERRNHEAMTREAVRKDREEDVPPEATVATAIDSVEQMPEEVVEDITRGAATRDEVLDELRALVDSVGEYAANDDLTTEPLEWVAGDAVVDYKSGSGYTGDEEYGYSVSVTYTSPDSTLGVTSYFDVTEREHEDGETRYSVEDVTVYEEFVDPDEPEQQFVRGEGSYHDFDDVEKAKAEALSMANRARTFDSTLAWNGEPVG